MATAPGFSVAIVYESTDALERAKRFGIRFAAERAADGSLDVSRWDFHLLGQRAIRNAAASTAAEADMVIVASSGINPLPARVEKWIEMWIWLVDRRKPTLVVLASTDHPAVASIRGYLAKCAASKGLTFVPHTDFTPADPRGDTERFADAPSELARCRTSTVSIQGAPSRPFRHPDERTSVIVFLIFSRPFRTHCCALRSR